jgi:hypothetical protein
MEVYGTQIASSHQLLQPLVPTGCRKGDHQYVALRRQGVMRRANSSSTEKENIIQKEEEEGKMERINTMKTNCMTTWNVRTLYRTEGLRMTINELVVH